MASALLSHRPSPTASPSLLPASMSVPSPSRSPLPIFPASASPRTYARAPPARPYALSPRNSQRALDVDGDTKAFADSVVGIIEDRARKIRSGGFAQDSDVEDEGRQQARKGRSLGGSIAGSWEIERAEFIVDVPVWSPGCFQDLSTLHALRDTTLSHTHSLLAYLMNTHSVPASYRLLPRSAINGPQKGKKNCRHQPGWGCIRLAPSITSPVQHKRELKPAVRRTSAVYPRRPSVEKHGRKSGKDVHDDIPPFKLDMDHAIADEDEEEEVQVELKEGYRQGTLSSDDEEEEECADVLVAREVEKRGTKEGEAFMMTLFGAPALILC